MRVPSAVFRESKFIYFCSLFYFDCSFGLIHVRFQYEWPLTSRLTNTWQIPLKFLGLGLVRVSRVSIFESLCHGTFIPSSLDGSSPFVGDHSLLIASLTCSSLHFVSSFVNVFLGGYCCFHQIILLFYQRHLYTGNVFRIAAPMYLHSNIDNNVDFSFFVQLSVLG